MPEVSGTYLASLTGKTWRTVRKRLDEARIRPVGRERNSDLFNSVEALAAIYAADAAGVTVGEFDTQRERLAAAQAENVEMNNAQKRRQIAFMPAVDLAVAEMIGNARARILNMGPKLGPQLVNIGNPSIISAAIRTECHAALAELAAYDPSGSELGGSEAPLVKDMGAAAEPDGQPVGRPRTKAEQRKRSRARPVAD